jgi:hypothetical protein
LTIDQAGVTIRATIRRRRWKRGIEVTGTREGEELRCQLESALAFADYCAFLTAGQGSERAAELVEVAERLFSETMLALGQDPAPASARPHWHMDAAV